MASLNPKFLALLEKNAKEFARNAGTNSGDEKVILPEDEYGNKRPIGWHGNELYRENCLVDWTLAQIEVFQKWQEYDKPISVLDIAGCSGFRAAKFAELGANATVIDLRDERRYLKERNKRLVERNRPPINFYQGNILKLNASEVIEICGNNRPSIVTAFNLIHFFDQKEISCLMKLVSEILPCGGLFCLSYDTADSESDKEKSLLTYHSPKSITGEAKENNFDFHHMEYKRFRKAPGGKVGQAYLRQSRLSPRPS